MRQKSVRDGFIHVWNGYKKYAWGADELKPVRPNLLSLVYLFLKVSKSPGGGWGGMAATLVDALDT